jgi:hypothetical protein
MEFRFRGFAGRLRENSAFQPSERHIVLGAGNRRSQRRGVDRADSTIMEIDPKTAAAQAKVSYSGDPKFAPIEGTSLYYATNTADKVIKDGDVYYLCLQAVWFMSPSAQGPWTTRSKCERQLDLAWKSLSRS